MNQTIEQAIQNLRINKQADKLATANGMDRIKMKQMIQAGMRMGIGGTPMEGM